MTTACADLSGNGSRAQRRYDALARVYDAVTLDRMVYGRARRRAVELLGLAPGDTVLDVGCGTGLSLSLLRRAVGPTGAVIAVDLSAGMLDRARRRIRRHGWSNVHVVRADAARLGDTALLDHAGPPDAALYALSLSVMPDPAGVLASTAALLASGGRVVVMDAGVPPENGVGRVGSAALGPVWRAAFRLAAADPRAHPWEQVRDVASGPTVEAFHFGYVRVAAGTLPAGRSQA